MVSYLIDSAIGAGAMIMGFAVVIGLIEADLLTEDPNDGVLALSVFCVPLVATALLQWTLLTRFSQSVGKMCMGIRIVNYNDVGRPGFGRVVVCRIWVTHLLGQLCGLYYLVDALFIFSEGHRCLHDRIASTRVVHAR